MTEQTEKAIEAAAKVRWEGVANALNLPAWRDLVESEREKLRADMRRDIAAYEAERGNARPAPTDEEIEKAAEAIYECCRSSEGVDGPPYSELAADEKSFARAMARAALNLTPDSPSA